MSLPLRISDELVVSAREEAEAADRSLTGQIEHWIKLGKALEEILTHRQVIQLKRGGAAVALTEAIERAGTVAGQEQALRALEASGRPRYGADPEHPGWFIRIDPGGARTRGRFVNRVFVPAAPDDGG